MQPTKKQLHFLRQVKHNTYSYGYIMKNGRVLPDESYIRTCIWNKWINYIDGSICSLTEEGKRIVNRNNNNNKQQTCLKEKPIIN